jgi:hypothetical protein
VVRIKEVALPQSALGDVEGDVRVEAHGVSLALVVQSENALKRGRWQGNPLKKHCGTWRKYCGLSNKAVGCAVTVSDID